MVEKRRKKARRWGDYIRLMLLQRDDPQAIANGVCIGLFIGFSPFYGAQIVLALLVALALRANKLATVLLVFVTNPFTLIPLYTLTYRVGIWIMPSAERDLLFNSLIQQLARGINGDDGQSIRSIMFDGLRAGWSILPPLIVGGLVVAACASICAYPLTLWLIQRFRAARRNALLHHVSSLGESDQ